MSNRETAAGQHICPSLLSRVRTSFKHRRRQRIDRKLGEVGMGLSASENSEIIVLGQFHADARRMLSLDFRVPRKAPRKPTLRAKNVRLPATDDIINMGG